MMLLAKHAEDQSLEVVTLDSVASLVPTEEISRDPRDEDRIAGQARMMSRALRRITTVNRKTLFLWTNQERTNVGITFGNPRTTSGGRALRFYATGRLEMRRGTKVMTERLVPRAGRLVKAKVQSGRWIQVRAEKEKSTRPNREGSFIFSNDLNSIDIASEIIQLGLEDGLIERTQRGFSYTDLDDKVWKGGEKQFSAYLRDNAVLQAELLDVIRDNTIRQEMGGEGEG